MRVFTGVSSGSNSSAPLIPHRCANGTGSKTRCAFHGVSSSGVNGNTACADAVSAPDATTHNALAATNAVARHKQRHVSSTPDTTFTELVDVAPAADVYARTPFCIATNCVRVAFPQRGKKNAVTIAAIMRCRSMSRTRRDEHMS
jgi:hypothetical protein